MTEAKHTVETASEAQVHAAPKGQKRTVLDVEDIVNMAPVLKGHEGLVRKLMRWLSVDKVNDIHSRHFDTPGPAFAKALVDEFRINLKIDGEDVLDNLPQGPFITVSNHPLGALDGIILISLVGSRRPDYKVMVNMMLNYITAMQPNFIAVDALASDDPKKKAVSMLGIKQAIMQVRAGKPIGFFPAGAVGKPDWRGRVMDRQWQPSIIRLIEQLGAPVIPIYFHDSNSWVFKLLGMISWKLRTLRLPAEVFNKNGSAMRISVGRPISVEEQKKHQGSVEEFGQYLKSQTFALRDAGK